MLVALHVVNRISLDLSILQGKKKLKAYLDFKMTQIENWPGGRTFEKPHKMSAFGSFSSVLNVIYVIDMCVFNVCYLTN